MLVPGPIEGPGTVEDLVADARLLGHATRQRVIMDWQSLGLLDYPKDQGGAGKGHGSKKSLYSRNQRMLFRLLVQKRIESGRMKRLIIIPISMWLYWGEEHIPLRQLRRAMQTWLRGYGQQPTAYAEVTADEIIDQLRHPAASTTTVNRARRLLIKALRDGVAPDEDLTATLQTLFDPQREGRTLGPPEAPLSPENIVGTARHRARGAELVRTDALSDDAYRTARARHLQQMSWYLTRRPALAAAADPAIAHLFNEPTGEDLIHNAGADLLLQIGLDDAFPAGPSSTSGRAP